MPDMMSKSGEGLRSGDGSCARETGPDYSIVIPIHNEAECLEEEVSSLVTELEARRIDYELLLAENGSSDDTPAVAEALAATNPRIRVLRSPVPDYGAAMKTGMLTGKGDLIVNFDIDFYDVDFMLKAGQALASSPSAGIVVGSKLMRGAEDRRSVARRFVSLGFTTILRVLFDRRMDDTHGVKVLRREVVARYAPQTVRTQDLFDTELIIRARRAGVAVIPLPVTVEKEKASFFHRAPNSAYNRRPDQAADNPMEGGEHWILMHRRGRI